MKTFVMSVRWGINWEKGTKVCRMTEALWYSSVCIFLFFYLTPRLQIHRLDSSEEQLPIISLPCTAFITASWCLQLSALALFCSILLPRHMSVCLTDSPLDKKVLWITERALPKQDLSFKGHVVIGGTHPTISQRF